VDVVEFLFVEPIVLGVVDFEAAVRWNAFKNSATTPQKRKEIKSEVEKQTRLVEQDSGLFPRLGFLGTLPRTR
jgi:hypothetical protein